MAAYHQVYELRADCLDIGISSGHNADIEYGTTLTFLFIFFLLETKMKQAFVYIFCVRS